MRVARLFALQHALVKTASLSAPRDLMIGRDHHDACLQAVSAAKRQQLWNLRIMASNSDLHARATLLSSVRAWSALEPRSNNY